VDVILEVQKQEFQPVLLQSKHVELRAWLIQRVSKFYTNLSIVSAYFIALIQAQQDLELMLLEGKNVGGL
jgi:hypothetical protein